MEIRSILQNFSCVRKSQRIWQLTWKNCYFIITSLISHHLFPLDMICRVPLPPVYLIRISKEILCNDIFMKEKKKQHTQIEMKLYLIFHFSIWFSRFLSQGIVPTKQQQQSARARAIFHHSKRKQLNQTFVVWMNESTRKKNWYNIHYKWSIYNNRQ